MTIAVLATPKTETKTKRRDPLRAIDMATSQVQARGAAPGTGKGRRTSTRLSMNSNHNQEKDEGNQNHHHHHHVNGVEKKKRKAATYHEDVGGFQFTRITTKKPRPSIDAIPEVPINPDSLASEKSVPQQQKSPRRGRPPKTRVEEEQHTIERVAEAEATTKTMSTAAEIPTKRRTRRSSNMVSAGAETKPESDSPPRSTRSGMRKRDHPPPADPLPVEKKRKKGRPAKNKTEEIIQEERDGFKSPALQQQTGTSKVALPLADTPVIQRNKEMREGKSIKGQKRRSSLGMRGRRASSLIDSGASNALPHKEVGTADFYKHIASDLPEPRRMRQLLIWCATRAMGDKPSGSRSEDESARLAARVIQEELLKDFANNSELSNWFGREEVNPPAVVVRKPNPKNIQNAEKIKELEEQIQRLQRERHALNALLKPPSIPQIKPPVAKQQPEAPSSGPPSQPELSSSDTSVPESLEPQSIDKSLLDPSQQEILSLLDPPNPAQVHNDTQSEQEPPAASARTHLPPLPPSAVSSRLSHIRTNLAPTLDAFAAGIHDIELYRATADIVSSRILCICSRRLEERDARNALRKLTIEDNGGDEGEGQMIPREDLGVILGALSRVERRS